jgi:hypothetical protein
MKLLNNSTIKICSHRITVLVTFNFPSVTLFSLFYSDNNRSLQRHVPKFKKGTLQKLSTLCYSASTISHVSYKVCDSETLGRIFVLNVESNFSTTVKYSNSQVLILVSV